VRYLRVVPFVIVGLILLPIAFLPPAWLALNVAAAFGAVHAYRVPGPGMERTLRCAGGYGCTGSHPERVLVLDYLIGKPGRGDIVVFHTPPAAARLCGSGGTYIKRLIGLPGERVEERAGVLYVDGQPLREPYIEEGRRDFENFGPQTVGRGRYFLLGDNRSSSCDSRQWGSVERAAIIGYVAAVYWPPGRMRLA
jgi:signal peptidase I